MSVPMGMGTGMGGVDMDLDGERTAAAMHGAGVQLDRTDHGAGHVSHAAAPSAWRRLIEGARVELVPMRSLDAAIDDLAPRSTISMTCSPAASIERTLDECERLVALGHRAVPHLAARMVRDDDHLRAIHERLVELDLREIFVVAGDADPPGCFFDALEFLEAFLRLDDATARRQVDHVGFTSYPDTHPLITDAELHEALHRKQQLILGSGRSAHVSTQMCFSTERVRTWARRERTAGLTVPIHLGVPGVIDASKLLSTGLRLGVGPSLRYLRKNRSSVGRLVARRSFEPDVVLEPLAAELDELGIDGLHLFTFNQVAATEEWRRRRLAATS